MTGLLVSVRDASEAKEALQGGARLIDVKEPRGGALGAASTAACREVLEAVGGQVPVSVALGELRDATGTEQAHGADYAKLGLAGLAQTKHWVRDWMRRLHQLPPATTAVAVVYADWQQASAPSPDEVIEASVAAGCGAVLVDTYSKQHGDVFAHLAEYELQRLAALVRANKQQFVLGGSLSIATMERAVALNPDWVAVRGAASWPHRSGRVRADLVAALVERLPSSPDGGQRRWA